jgi:hypothetical protein
MNAGQQPSRLGRYATWVQRRVAAALTVALVLTASEAESQSHEGAYLEAHCSALGGCSFTNTGTEAGRACATLILTDSSGESIRSGVVCSGPVEPSSTTAAVPVHFVGDPALAFCGRRPPCTPSVELSNVTSDATPFPWAAVVWSVVIASSVWVFFDARRRRERGDLGASDTGPGAWFVACLALWIVAFPAYLWSRRRRPAPVGVTD